MPKRKTSIKALPESETGNNGVNANKCVFTLSCKHVIDELLEELKSKPTTMKQVVAFSLLSMDESSRKDVIKLMKENKRFDREIEAYIKQNKRHIVKFFSEQRDFIQNVAYLKNRIAELEAMVGVKDDKEYI